MRHTVLGTTTNLPIEFGGVFFEVFFSLFVCLIFNHQMIGFKKDLSNKLNNCIAILTMKWNEEPDLIT